MKVKVKDTPVFYDGHRYKSGETLQIDKKYFNSTLFEEVQQKKKLTQRSDSL